MASYVDVTPPVGVVGLVFSADLACSVEAIIVEYNLCEEFEKFWLIKEMFRILLKADILFSVNYEVTTGEF